MIKLDEISKKNIVDVKHRVGTVLTFIAIVEYGIRQLKNDTVGVYLFEQILNEFNTELNELKELIAVYDLEHGGTMHG